MRRVRAGISEKEGARRTRNVKEAQRRPGLSPVVRSTMEVTEWQGFVCGVCVGGGGGCHIPDAETLSLVPPPPQVSPALTLDGPYSPGTQEAHYG